jgi:hypothetical protein
VLVPFLHLGNKRQGHSVAASAGQT